MAFSHHHTAEVGDYLTGFSATGASRIVGLSYHPLTGEWLYELENGAIVAEFEITCDNVLLESEVL